MAAFEVVEANVTSQVDVAECRVFDDCIVEVPSENDDSATTIVVETDIGQVVDVSEHW